MIEAVIVAIRSHHQSIVVVVPERIHDDQKPEPGSFTRGTERSENANQYGWTNGRRYCPSETSRIPSFHKFRWAVHSGWLVGSEWGSLCVSFPQPFSFCHIPHCVSSFAIVIDISKDKPNHCTAIRSRQQEQCRYLLHNQVLSRKQQQQQQGTISVSNSKSNSKSIFDCNLGQRNIRERKK